MESSRLPRFKRAAVIAPMQLTGRDKEIIRQVYRHRFLRSSQIIALVGESSQQLLRRLKLLYHHGYLERPRGQIDYFHRGGSQTMVYGIGNKSREFLKQEFGSDLHLNWNHKNQSVGRIFLEHALLVSEVMVSMELACCESGHTRLIADHQLRAENEEKLFSASFHWNIKLPAEVTLGVIPDKVFALEYSLQAGLQNRAYFFLEADRGTMPVIRRNLTQPSFYRKLLAYEATWRQSVHKRRFGFHRFRVLTVTTSAERVKSLVDACSQLKGGYGLFLFAHHDAIKKPADILSPIWKAGLGETVRLLG